MQSGQVKERVDLDCVAFDERYGPLPEQGAVKVRVLRVGGRRGGELLSRDRDGAQRAKRTWTRRCSLLHTLSSTLSSW